MNRRWLKVLAVGMVLLVSACSAPPPVEEQATVRGVFFWSVTCPHCHEVMEEHLPPLEQQYADQLEIKKIELSDSASYQLWLAATDAYEVPPDQQSVPMLFIGDSVLVGSFEIPDQLPGLIEHHLAAGGLDYPAFPDLLADASTTSAPESASASPSIHVSYIYQSSCQECDRVQLALDYLENEYPQLVVCAHDVREEAACTTGGKRGAAKPGTCV